MSAFSESQGEADSLASAIKILEISDISSIKRDDLKLIRKRAMRRWHPDRIAHSNPSADIVKEYEDNFKNIESALEEIEAFLKDGLGAGYRTKGPLPERQVEPEEIVRRNAAENQTILSQTWSRVKAQKFEFEQEDVVLTEGVSIQDALNEDLKDKVPALAIFSLGAGFLYLLIGVIAGAFVAAILEFAGFGIIGSLLVSAIVIAWALHGIACILFLLPLSRFWLPPNISDPIISVINATLRATQSWAHDTEGFGKWVYGILSVFSFLAHWLIAFPVYKIVGLALREQRIGRNVVIANFYSGYGEGYIERLMTEPTESLSLDELFDLSSVANRFKSLGV